MADKECDDCDRDYCQPFTAQPMRLLWWLDYKAHRSHNRTLLWTFRPLCNWLDGKLGF